MTIGLPAAVGGDARRQAGKRPGRRRSLTTLLDVLRGAGYEPQIETSDGTVSLRNCPYDALASQHRELTCGMNLAWADGVTEALVNSGLQPELAPQPGDCCVLFRPADRAVRTKTPHQSAGRAPGEE